MTSNKFDMEKHPHRRHNILTGEWVLVSPHRTKRPWQGRVEKKATKEKVFYDENCYLCPNNTRAGGHKNPNYKDVFVFDNDFAALIPDSPKGECNMEELLKAKSETGICRVINFSPNHSLTLAQMNEDDILSVIKTWVKQYEELAAMEDINYVQIFENKGDIMGNSNPHPHGQIWAQISIPDEPAKKTLQQKKYYNKYKKGLLEQYINIEKKQKERIVFENNDFLVLVPFWAIWPYETMIIPKRMMKNISLMTLEEKKSFAQAIKKITTIYDRLFDTSFPYSAGIHQAPTDGGNHESWHWHMVFYPPLLRSATVKKFMVGYEMLANPQRDITAEVSAKTLRNLNRV